MNKLSEAIERYKTTPRIFKNWHVWAFRRLFLPTIKMPCWLVSNSGTKFFLGKDPVGDRVLEEIFYKSPNLYFPGNIYFHSEQLIMDIGAHHGFYSVEALRRYPFARLIAVEPNPSSVLMLRKNVVANNLSKRIEIIEAGIASKNGTSFLAYGDIGSWRDTLYNTTTHLTKGVNVPTRTILDILQGRKPYIVKCNAEGGEFDLFPQLFVGNIFPEFVILMAHPEYGSVNDLINLFTNKGYAIRDAGSTTKRILLHCSRV